MLNSIKDTFRELRLPAPPFWMVGAAVILLVVSWVPLILVARSRVARSPLPPIHLIQDMDKQAKLRMQQPSQVFSDGRSMRPIVPGTVARGQILDDPHYTQGYRIINGVRREAQYFEGMPDRVTVDAALLKRGQQRFNIFCSPCHGLDGSGNGIINQRALELVAAGVLNQSLPVTEWIQVANLAQVDETSGKLKFGSTLYPNGDGMVMPNMGETVYPDGMLFNTLTNGRGNMPPLGSQISIEDRWAIVAYVRALQASQHMPIDKLTAEQTQQLETP